MSDASVPLMVTWSILIAFAFVLAAKDFGQLVDLYQSEPTTLSVSVESNTNFFIPNPTICMETNIPYLSKERANITKGSYYTTSGIDKDIDLLLQSTDNLTNLDRMAFTQRLYYYFYALLSYWTDAEMRLVGQQQPYHRKLFTDWSIKDPHLGESIQTVYNQLKTRNVSLAMLKRFVAKLICKYLIPTSLRYSKFYELLFANAPLYDTCSQDKLTHLSFSLLCMKVFGENNLVQLNESNALQKTYYIDPFDNYGVQEYNRWLNLMTHDGANYQYLALSLNRSIFPPPTVSSMSDPDNTWVNYRFYLDLKGRSTLPQLIGDSVISWNPLENNYVRVSVISEFQYYNSKSKPCATETKYECEWRQRVEQIHQKCGCWPSSLIFAANSSLHPRCEVDLSASYMGIAAVGHCKGNLNFSFNCPSECQLLSYEKGNRESSFWNVPLLRYPLYKAGPFGHFQLTLQTSNQRLVITESLYKDWTTFAAEFGGSIGTWLGRYTYAVGQKSLRPLNQAFPYVKLTFTFANKWFD